MARGERQQASVHGFEAVLGPRSRRRQAALDWQDQELTSALERELKLMELEIAEGDYSAALTVLAHHPQLHTPALDQLRATVGQRLEAEAQTNLQRHAADLGDLTGLVSRHAPHLCGRTNDQRVHIMTDGHEWQIESGRSLFSAGGKIGETACGLELSGGAGWRCVPGTWETPSKDHMKERCPECAPHEDLLGVEDRETCLGDQPFDQAIASAVSSQVAAALEGVPPQADELLAQLGSKEAAARLLAQAAAREGSPALQRSCQWIGDFVRNDHERRDLRRLMRRQASRRAPSQQEWEQLLATTVASGSYRVEDMREAMVKMLKGL